MWFFRLKWIFYHLLSSLIALIALVLLVGVFLPELNPLLLEPFTILVLLAAAAAASIFSAVIGGYYSSREIRSQLEEITLGAKNLAYGNLDYRLGYKGNAEFDGIIQAFNEMATRLQAQVGPQSWPRKRTAPPGDQNQRDFRRETAAGPGSP